MPINPTVQVTAPADPADDILSFYMQSVQDAFDTTKALVNTNETNIALRVAKDAANRIAASTVSPLIEIAQTGTGAALEVEDNLGLPSYTVMSDGTTVIGDPQTGQTFGMGSQFKIIGGVNADTKVTFAKFGANALGFDLHFYKSRSLTVDGRDSAALDDELGEISFDGDAGASEEQGAYIRAEVDGPVSEAATISTITRTANVVTVVTAAAHGRAVSDPIAVEGVAQPSFNGNFTVSTVPNSTTLTYAQVAGDSSDNTGIVAARNLPTRIVVGVRGVNATAAAEAFRIGSAGRINGMKFIAGTVSAPSVAVGESDTGFFLSTVGNLRSTHLGVEGVRLTANGVGIGTDALSTIQLSILKTGADPGAGAAAIQVVGETSCIFILDRTSADTGQPNAVMRKARGTAASRSAVLTNDFLGTLTFQGYGATAFQPAGQIRSAVIAATPSDTDMEARLNLFVSPAGSVGLTEIVRWEHATGQSMFGANPVINQDRNHKLRSYTVATVPSAAPAGLMIYVSNETGGATVAFSDGTNWRRVQDRAVVA